MNAKLLLLALLTTITIESFLCSNNVHSMEVITSNPQIEPSKNRRTILARICRYQTGQVRSEKTVAISGDLGIRKSIIIRTWVAGQYQVEISKDGSVVSSQILSYPKIALQSTQTEIINLEHLENGNYTLEITSLDYGEKDSGEFILR